MKLTPFGIEVRKLRLDAGMLMKDMADKLGVSPSWLSAMETGRKSVPDDLVPRISRLFGLTGERVERLAEAARASRQQFTLNPGNDPLRRDVAAALARRFDEFDEEELRKLQSIVRGSPK